MVVRTKGMEQVHEKEGAARTTRERLGLALRDVIASDFTTLRAIQRTLTRKTMKMCVIWVLYML